MGGQKKRQGFFNRRTEKSFLTGEQKKAYKQVNRKKRNGFFNSRTEKSFLTHEQKKTF